ncbi:MAG: outer membrane lipid asymmetry maintenance protein MlaD [Silicimonas sp.]|nr:outer membrane lipid asymmetry maintenance protein MlaD [Silicimonas sp.]NNF92307.1 outer membrane lipid asymmetry maintenance protein MlaD [Boseongicola sp.]RZV99562.1 MAG: outer membrane lipid asymmetry maintenance protein MlaD [Paracoccaceae bacterium]NND17174.1 outer membrane lipid asymmetry maintenance protein MlaD [Silicimonas sp.]NND21361.1 outer membrane lipid asymmetry maintenance protein MlaD [Silicimonas sp.]
MSEHTTEVLTGAGVLAVAAGFLIYMAQVGGIGGGSAGDATYTASFRSVEGVGVGTDVRLAGVKVGSVLDMDLDPATFRAETVLSVDPALELPDDTAVIISSEGLLGGSFVELLPGGSAFSLEPGSEIVDTQSSISVVQLLLKFVSGDGE